MKKNMRRSAIAVAAFALIMACAKVPITGRRQLNLANEQTLMAMGVTEYGKFLSENPPLPDNDPRVQQTRKVGQRIAEAATRFLNENNMSSRVAGFEWNFNVVNDQAVNAWCMPGGKVVVYTGILPVTQDEVGLAVVMGHEVSHAIARHGNERMSQGLALQFGGVALEVLTGENPGVARDLFLQVYGVGGSLGMLSYSRKHETEADKLGLVFMAMAGYDPREAPKFWGRMSQGGGQAPPEILSTHPSDQTRMRDLEAFMPEALKYYKPGI
jgi:predicted Zn-dependent protease